MTNPQFLIRKQKAAEVIAQFMEELRCFQPSDETSRDAGRRMVQIFRIFTGEMPMVEDLDLLDLPLDPPAIEFSSPNEGDPSGVVYVHPGLGSGPDIIIQGDQHDQEEGLVQNLKQEDVSFFKEEVDAAKARQERLRFPALPPKKKAEDDT